MDLDDLLEDELGLHEDDADPNEGERTTYADAPPAAVVLDPTLQSTQLRVVPCASQPSSMLHRLQSARSRKWTQMRNKRHLSTVRTLAISSAGHPAQSRVHSVPLIAIDGAGQHVGADVPRPSAVRSAKKPRAGAPHMQQAAQHSQRPDEDMLHQTSDAQQRGDQAATQSETQRTSQWLPAGQPGTAAESQEDSRPPDNEDTGRWDDFLDDLLAPSQPVTQHASQQRATEQAAGATKRPSAGGQDDDDTDDDECEDLLEVTMRRQPEPDPCSPTGSPARSLVDHAETSPTDAGADAEVCQPPVSVSSCTKKAHCVWGRIDTRRDDKCLEASAVPLFSCQLLATIRNERIRA